MSGFMDILKKPASKVEAPKPLPLGSYVCTVDTIPAPRDAKDYKVLEIPLIVTSPGDDVDPDALEAYGKVQGYKLRQSYFFGPDENANDGNLYRLTAFLTDHLGIEAGKKTVSEMLAEAKGRQCLATIKWTPREDDPNLTRVDVKGTAPLA